MPATVDERSGTGRIVPEGLALPRGAAVLWSSGSDSPPDDLERQGGVVTRLDVDTLVAEARGESPRLSASGFDAVFLDAEILEADPLAVISAAHKWLGNGGKLYLSPAANGCRRSREEGADYQQLAAWCGFREVGTVRFGTGFGSADVWGRASPRWRVDHARPDDGEGLHDLFAECFGHSISSSLWQWKYGDGRGRGAIVRHEGEVVAHYGGMSRPMMFFGQPEMAVQIGDVMVKPSERAAFTRKGPFFLTTAAFLESYIGHGRAHLLGFGFPNHRHMRLAEKLGLYAHVGRIVEVSWPTSASARLPRKRVTGLDRLPEVGARQAVNWLWKQMQKDFRDAVIGVRDWSYIRHRYLSHPERDYDVRMIRDWVSGRPRGIVVLGEQDGAVELVDMVGPLEAMPLLIRESLRLARLQGKERLYCWACSQYAGFFEAAGGTAAPLDVEVPTSAWTPGPAVEGMTGKWWLMSGDTDFR